MSGAERTAKGASSRGGAARRALGWVRRTIGDENPVTSREIRTLARLRSVGVGTALVPLLCTGLVLVVALDALVGTSPYTVPSQRGPLLLEVGSWAGLLLLALLGSVLGAQAVGGERQGRTLETLLLTGMSPWRIVLGKALGVWALLALVVLACLPPMGVCFLLGGVSLPQLLAAAALLLVASLVPVAFGVFLGAALRSPRLAVGLAVVLVGMAGPLGALPMMVLGLVLARGQDPSLIWWADLLARDGASGSALLSGLAAPLFAVAAPTWLFLGGAVSSLTPAGGDGSRPLKWWLLVTAPLGAVLLTLLGREAGAGPEASVGLLGLLGLYLAAGAVALAAHPARRRPASTAADRLLGRGPGGGAAFVVAVSGLSLGAAWAVGAGGPAPAATAMAAAVVLGLVALLAGSSVLLAVFVPPRVARLALVGAAVVVLLGPMAVALALSVSGGTWGHGETAVAAELSPLGSLLRLVDESRHGEQPAPPLFAVLWLAAGAAFAWGGRALRRVRAERA